MGVFQSLLQRVTGRSGATIQDDEPSQAFRDYKRKGSSYSIESEVSEALANLAVMLSSMPVSGDSERARWLDGLSDEFFRNKIFKLIASAFLTGDCLVVPSWTGRGMQNILVPSYDFAIMETMGDEVTACAYVIDRTKKGLDEYQLLQAVELVPYESAGGERLYANRYRLFVARNWSATGASLSDFPQWKDRYEQEWFVPNVDRLLIGRFKSFTVDPLHVNNVKGLPICYGASDPIRQIRTLLDRMRDEFELSEKAIFADKRLFRKQWIGDETYTVLPEGRERLFMEAAGSTGEMPIHDWAPEIRYNAYLEAIDKHEKRLEKAVGVSTGIISTPDDINYQNVDNVRKSQQSTISFINNARNVAEHCLLDLVYAWDRLANYYGVVPIGDYQVSFDWSDDYIETFADRQNAILAGSSIGATDAVDYRQFLFDESPEAARERVAEIAAQAQPFAIAAL